MSSARGRLRSSSRGTRAAGALPGRWRWRAGAGPGPPAQACAQELLNFGGVTDHLDIQDVVPRIHDDRPDLQDPLAESLVKVHALELRVWDHFGILVEDPILADDLVVRDVVPCRPALQLGWHERKEREEQGHGRDD